MSESGLVGVTMRHELIRNPPGNRTTVATPVGEFVVASDVESCRVGGPCSIVIPLVPRISMATVRRGVEGRIDGAPLRIRRPRFGFRRANRPVEITGPQVDLETDYRASRRYQVRRRQNGEVVYERRGRQTFVKQDAPAAEIAVALAVEIAGIIDTSSFVNYITGP